MSILKIFYTKKIHRNDMRWILVFYVVVQGFILHLGAANKADDEGEGVDFVFW